MGKGRAGGAPGSSHPQPPTSVCLAVWHVRLEKQKGCELWGEGCFSQCFHIITLARPPGDTDRETTQGRKLPGPFPHYGSPVLSHPAGVSSQGPEGLGERLRTLCWPDRAGTSPGLGPVPSTQLTRAGCLSLPCQKSNSLGQPAPKPVSLGILGGNGLWVLGDGTGKDLGACLLPPCPSPGTCNLTWVLNNAQHPPVPQQPPCAKMTPTSAPPSPHSEQQGGTPAQPGPPNLPRTLSRPRARPPACPQGPELDLRACPQADYGRWASLRARIFLPRPPPPTATSDQRLLTSESPVLAAPWPDSASSADTSTSSQGSRTSLSLSGQAVPGKAPPACLEFPAGLRLPLSIPDFSIGSARIRGLRAPHPWPQPSMSFQDLFPMHGLLACPGALEEPGGAPVRGCWPTFHNHHLPDCPPAASLSSGPT